MGVEGGAPFLKVWWEAVTNSKQVARAVCDAGLSVVSAVIGRSLIYDVCFIENNDSKCLIGEHFAGTPFIPAFISMKY